jgi:hypothetical protein
MATPASSHDCQTGIDFIISKRYDRSYFICILLLLKAVVYYNRPEGQDKKYMKEGYYHEKDV